MATSIATIRIIFHTNRRPESTAYIPYGCGRHYVCGAFNGGTAEAFLRMCKTLAKNVQTDINNNINAIVDDESHLNAYLYNHDFLLAGREYGFPENEIKRIPPRQRVMIKIISRSKDNPKYGGTAYLRGQTDKKMSSNIFATEIRRTFARIITVFIPIKKYRRKIRAYFW